MGEIMDDAVSFIPLPQRKIAPNTIRAHVVPGANITPDAHLRPAKIKRDWMDAIPERYIYRCIPLLAANTMGWELLNPVTSCVKWDGGVDVTALNIDSEKVDRFAASSHFGNGIVTWYVPFLFKTSPELGLIVTGPANHEHNHAVPLNAFIRTDWLPFPFTMNWRMTQTDTEVTFQAGDAIACILPFPLQMLEDTQLEISDLADDPGFLAEVNAFGKARQKNVQAQQANAAYAQETGEDMTTEGVWNAQYVRAKGGAEVGFQQHQTIFKVNPPVDKRR